MAPQVGAALGEAYRFGRVLENRLQIRRDAQTHRLPEDGENARGWPLRSASPTGQGLLSALDARRERVAAEFNALLGQLRGRDADAGELASYWLRCRTRGRHADATPTLQGRVRGGGNADASRCAISRVRRACANCPVLVRA